MKSYPMKSYLSLIPISAKKRRKQNRLTMICIILAVFLVTSVFSMAEVMMKDQEEAMIKKHGNYHITISGLSEEAENQIAHQSNVSATSRYCTFGEEIYEGYQVGDRRVIMYGTEQAYIEDIRNYEIEGTYPQDDNEVMLNTTAKEALGIRIGDRVTIHTPAGEFDYTVTGFCVDEWVSEAVKYDGVCAYMNVGAFRTICSANGYADEESIRPVLYVQFKEKTKLREAIADMKAYYGIPDGDIKENIITVGMSGASSNQGINWIYGLAVAVFAMVLIAGVLMISSCMNSNVSQRTKFFGMMRCVGASKTQVMRFVRLEALNWCKIAIPIGLGVGIVFTWILCIVLKNVVGGEFSSYSFRFSIVAVVCGASVGVITVLLAAHAPAKRAAAVSPMAAVSGNAESGRKISRAANTRMFKVESALGVYHAAMSRKNMTLMSLSFAFTAALFLTFYAGLDFARKLLPSESDLNPDISIAAIDNRNSIDRGLKEQIGAVPGVEAAFGCAMSTNVPADINGVPGSVDLVSYDDYMFSWTKKSVVSGDLSKVDGDTDYVFTIFNRDSRLDTGDKIKIGETELEIACVVSEGIGVEGISVCCTEETFQRITGEDKYNLLNAQLTKDATEETVETIRTLTGENEFYDRREDNQTSNSTFWVFRIAAYGFLTIIALITVFNIMNSISMSVSARMKQYGAMRAVGMSVHQMTKMIAAEAVTYAVCGMVIGLAGGLYMHRLLMNKLIYSHFGGTWSIPFEPIIIVLLIFVLACTAAVLAPARRIREMAITETVNEL